MERSTISSWTPPELAERAADRGEQEFSAEDLADAKWEIVDAIMSTQKGWKGHDLFSMLQEYLNVAPQEFDSRLGLIAKHMQHMIYGNDADRPAPRQDLLTLARSDADSFLRGIVENHVSAERVEERACEIAGEKLEDAA